MAKPCKLQLFSGNFWEAPALEASCCLCPLQRWESWARARFTMRGGDGDGSQRPPRLYAGGADGRAGHSGRSAGRRRPQSDGLSPSGPVPAERVLCQEHLPVRRVHPDLLPRQRAVGQLCPAAEGQGRTGGQVGYPAQARAARPPLCHPPGREGIRLRRWPQ